MTVSSSSRIFPRAFISFILLLTGNAYTPVTLRRARDLSPPTQTAREIVNINQSLDSDWQSSRTTLIRLSIQESLTLSLSILLKNFQSINNPFNQWIWLIFSISFCQINSATEETDHRSQGGTIDVIVDIVSIDSWPSVIPFVWDFWRYVKPLSTSLKRLLIVLWRCRHLSIKWMEKYPVVYSLMISTDSHNCHQTNYWPMWLFLTVCVLNQDVDWYLVYSFCACQQASPYRA